MSPIPTSPNNPSLAVERIREIIVGRHLERIEERVARLEAAGPPGSTAPSREWEDRLVAGEARIEALRESLGRLGDSVRDAVHHRSARQQEEIERLAARIQEVAARNAEDEVQPAIRQLETRLGAWLNNWQSALQKHLNNRDQQLAGQLRQEVATLWENTESQITRLQSRALDHERIEERFRRIAAAARALAESAAPLADGFETSPR